MRRFIQKLKDPVSGLTHFIGTLLAIAGLTLLVVKASQMAKPWHSVTFAIFGTGMVLLYASSTLYHWIKVSENKERCLKRLDHMMIFILIAATYTPICLIPLRGGWGWSLFGVVWGIAVIGIVLKVFWIHAPTWLSTLIYVCMGWLALIGIWPLIQILQPGALYWLFIGGVFYTVGAIIYASEWPVLWPKIFGSHELFHVLVMLGSLSHFWVMYNYIMVFD